MPEEPLFGADPTSAALANPGHAFAQICAENAALESTRSRVEQIHIESSRAKLLRLLQFCQSNDVDVVVFPEYSIPPACIDILKGFSSEMTIVAGLGVLRPADVLHIEKTLQAEAPPAYSNCATVFGPNLQEFVTKLHPAEGEYMETGDGPCVFDVEIRGEMRRMGVAICMDFLHVGQAFQNDGAQIDFVAVPVLSRTTDVFVPDEPRDFVRIIANHSAFGGTRLVMPSSTAPAFANESGSIPLHRKEEAIVVGDYERFQTKPSSLTPPNNRIVFRTSVLSSPTQYEQNLVEAVDGLATNETVGTETITAIDGWIERISGVPKLAGIAECLSEYKRLTMTGVLSLDEATLFTTHLGVQHGQASHALRVEQAREIRKALSRLRRNKNDDILRGAQECYAALEAEPDPDPQLEPFGVSPDSATRNTYFSFGLGSYSSEDAQATLPYQLDLLRAFGLSFDNDVSLTYRLTTRENAVTDDVGATFEVILGGDRPAEEMSEAIDEFSRIYQAVLVRGWNIYGSDASLELGGTYKYALEPKQDGHTKIPAIRADWGAVVDVVRAIGEPLAVEFSCSPLGSIEAQDGLDSVDSAVDPLSVPIGPISDIREAGDFLVRQDLEHAEEEPALQLSVVIASERVLSSGTLNTLGSMIFGHEGFAVRALTPGGGLVSGFDLRPDQALRIFHPPHGYIEGRGLRGTKKLSLLAKDMPLNQSGCIIGAATAARAHTDANFDLAIDAESRMRHVYVVGKTGSGKTNLLKNMVRQDIESGAGVAVIDPHGDLAEYALGHCGSRADECVYLDFGDPNYLPALNPLAVDVASEEDRLLATEELLDLITRRSFHEWFGPRFEDTIRMALDTLALATPGEPASLMDVPALLRDKSKRTTLLAKADQRLKDQWRLFDRMKDTEQAEISNWVLSKFAELEHSKVLRNVLRRGPASVSLASAVNDRKILIARLPEVTIGARAASFLGSLIVSRMSRHIVDAAAYGQRLDVDRPPFFMYVDEFQKFVGTGFETLIPEARKFNLGLVLAHQNTDQLRAFSRFEGTRDSSVLTQILGNVGSVLCFRCGSRDAEMLSDELGVSKKSLLRIGRYEAVARVVSGGIEQDAVTIRVHNSADEPGFPETRNRIRHALQESGVLLEVPDQIPPLFPQSEDGEGDSTVDSSFLDEWIARRNALRDKATESANEDAKEPTDEETRDVAMGGDENGSTSDAGANSVGDGIDKSDESNDAAVSDENDDVGEVDVA